MSQEPKRTRKPQIGIEVEANEKEMFQRVAKERRLTLSALTRVLLLDEARRLGIS